MNFFPSIADYGLIIATIAMGLYTAGALCFAYFLKDVEKAGDIPFKDKIAPFLVALPILITAGAFRTDYDMFGVGIIFLLYLANPGNRISRTIVLTAGVIYQYGLNLFSSYGDFVDGVFVETARVLDPIALYYFLKGYRVRKLEDVSGFVG